jgi:hypothetical protein
VACSRSSGGVWARTGGGCQRAGGGPPPGDGRRRTGAGPANGCAYTAAAGPGPGPSRSRPRARRPPVAIGRGRSPVARRPVAAVGPAGPDDPDAGGADHQMVKAVHQPGRVTSCNTSQPSSSSARSTAAVRRCILACRRQGLASTEGRKRSRHPVHTASSGAVDQPSRRRRSGRPAGLRRRRHQDRRHPPPPAEPPAYAVPLAVPPVGGPGRGAGRLNLGSGRARTGGRYPDDAVPDLRPAPEPGAGSGAGPPARRRSRRAGHTGRGARRRGADRPCPASVRRGPAARRRGRRRPRSRRCSG